MANELKPCPFCGGEAKIDGIHGAYVMDFSYVVCKECGANSKKILARHDICAKDEAINAWNRRWKDG